MEEQFTSTPDEPSHPVEDMDRTLQAYLQRVARSSVEDDLVHEPRLPEGKPWLWLGLGFAVGFLIGYGVLQGKRKIR